MKLLATVCGRKGSKGVRRKNIRRLGKHPLVIHTLMQIREANCLTKLIISSDDEELLELGNQLCDFTIFRAPELSGDSVAKIDVIRDALIKSEKHFNCTFDFVFDFDITSPLRTPNDIQQACKKLINSENDNLVSVCRARRSPYFNIVELGTNGVPKLSKTPKSKIFARQQSPEVYELNASIYGWKREVILDPDTDTIIIPGTTIFEMPPERSIDIDEEHDFEIVEFLMSKGRN